MMGGSFLSLSRITYVLADLAVGGSEHVQAARLPQLLPAATKHAEYMRNSCPWRYMPINYGEQKREKQ